MNTRQIKQVIIPITAIVILLAMVAWLAGSFNDKIAPILQANNHLKSSVPRAEQFIVSYSEQLSYEPVAASIEAKQATIISSRLLARIEQIKVRAGDNVKQGDVLIELEKSDLTALVSQAQERINGISARYQETEKSLARANKLYSDQLISAADLDSQKASFQSIEAELTAAKQARQQAQSTLAYATITAAIDGKVVNRFAEPGDTAQLGKKLLAIYNPLTLRVEANVREQLAITLQQGQTLQVQVPSINQTLSAKIEEIVPAANTGSRSFLIKASISYNQKLLPGMYARMLLPAKPQQVLQVPSNKIASMGQLNFVWIEENDELQRRFVRLGKKSSENMTIVVSGLNAGDSVINPPTTQD
mgnify:FL=1|tara:strand:+ start:3630 stop:4712 length:1083 start_codon:yes stop_codon:yes gene_type:complete